MVRVRDYDAAANRWIVEDVWPVATGGEAEDGDSNRREAEGRESQRDTAQGDDGQRQKADGDSGP